MYDFWYGQVFLKASLSKIVLNDIPVYFFAATEMSDLPQEAVLDELISSHCSRYIIHCSFAAFSPRCKIE